MDSFELNKIAGAVLGALLVIFGGKTLVDEAFKQKPPSTPGYEIEVASASATAGAPKEEEVIEPINVRLASADVSAGEKSFRKCSACHVVDAGGPNKVGPNLHNIVGAAIAAVEGFNYSNAFTAHGGNWGYEELDAFLANPKGYISGTKMAFAGLKKPDERANVIAYLKANTENPPALATE